MIDRTHSLSVIRQCQLLDLSRSSAYCQPAGISDDDLRLMRQTRIAALYPKANTSRPGKGHRVYPYLLKEYGTPDIFNTDQQGAQFTSDAFTGVPKAASIQIAPGGTPWWRRKSRPDRSMSLAAPGRMDPGIHVPCTRHGIHQGTIGLMIIPNAGRWGT